MIVTAMWLLASCGGAGDQPTSPKGPPTPPVDLTKPTAIAAVAGGGQTVRVRSSVASPITFKVTNVAGSGLANVTVSFAVTGGTLASATAVTASDGTVGMPTWTVGVDTGTKTVTATVGSLQAQAAVVARFPYWTVMVYMAADNTLAAYGAVNLYQMAAAGVNPEVQVVAQAEFNPEAFAQAGLGPGSVDRTNYDTFRYVMDGSVQRPPNNVLIGPATDIGNVDMADPSQLHAFVQWAEQVAPAEHTILVLWNHGGDATGLIDDETSQPGQPMTLSQLSTALTGFPKFDVLYFEMCLMGGYEPLRAVQSLARTAVASEDEEYVAGWDFQRLLQTLYAAPTAGANAVAARLADVFDASYASLGLSETISAYDLSGFASVDAAVSQLAMALKNASSVTPTGLAAGTANVQRYGFPWVADLVDLTDSIDAHVTDQGVLAATGGVRHAVESPTFLLTSHYRTGTRYGQRDEGRSHGLTIVMPGTGTYAAPSTGTASMAAYSQQVAGAAWTEFLQAYSSGLQTQQYVDVGANPLTIFLVWDTVFAKRGWTEMLMFEPDGDLYSPMFGTLSPSGQFSADAQVNQTYYEGWASNQAVQRGKFYYLAWLVSDTTNYQPYVDIQYRFGQAALTHLYGPGTYPRLSFATSFFVDPSPTWSKLESGGYTDLKIVATWTTSTASAALADVVPNGLDPASSGPMITPQQIAALHAIARNLTRSANRAPAFSRGRPGAQAEVLAPAPLEIRKH